VGKWRWMTNGPRGGSGWWRQPYDAASSERKQGQLIRLSTPPRSSRRVRYLPTLKRYWPTGKRGFQCRPISTGFAARMCSEASRSRVKDVLAMFRQRFLGQKSVTEALVILTQERLPAVALDRILYFHAAQADRLLHDAVTEILLPLQARGLSQVDVLELQRPLKKWVDAERHAATGRSPLSFASHRVSCPPCVISAGCRQEANLSGLPACRGVRLSRLLFQAAPAIGGKAG
jgi:hypothetical protein